MTPTSRSRLGKRPAAIPLDVAAVGAALLLFLASILTLAVARAADGPSTAPATEPATALATGPAAGAAATGDITRIRGVVRNPAGKPVAGARVAVVDNRPAADLLPLPEPMAEGRTDGDGRFDLSFRKPYPPPAADIASFSGVLSPPLAFANVVAGGADAGPLAVVVASADGYGPAWRRADGAGNAGNVELELVPDHPVEGRIVDLEGRPAAGVKVTPFTLAPYVAPAPVVTNRPAADNRDPVLIYPSVSTAAMAATTGADGRFRIAGLGADRIVFLYFDSATVTSLPAQVVTRDEAPPAQRAVSAGGRVVMIQRSYGARFDLVAAPARAGVGTVRDADTGRPLAGVRLVATRPGLRREVVTDERGQFRLDGLVKGPNRIRVVPPPDLPYFAHDRVVPDQTGIGALQLDIDLHRGVWITGRVTDKATGGPVAAFVQYAPFLSNKHAAIPEYQATQGARFYQGPQGSGTTAADGTYRVAGLPGPGVVAVVARDDIYPKGQGADRIKDSQAREPDPALLAGRPSFGTYQFWMAPERVTAVRGVELAAQATGGAGAHDVPAAAAVDFRVDPGSAVEVAMSGPSGNLLDGAWVVGDHPDGAISRVQGPTFRALQFGDDETRLLVLRGVDGQLGKVVAVRLADVPRRRLRVRLEPAVLVTGRVVDADGKPAGAASIRAETAVAGVARGGQRRLATARTEADGRFRINLFAGCDYSLAVESASPGSPAMTGGVGRFSIEAGAKTDLGDIRVAAE